MHESLLAVFARQLLEGVDNEEEAEDITNRADELKSGFFKDDAECPTKVLAIFEDFARGGNLLAMLRAVEMYLNGALSINLDRKPVRRAPGKAGKYFEAPLNHRELQDVNGAENSNDEIKVGALVHYGM